MMRGTFANIRIRNEMVSGRRGRNDEAPTRPATTMPIYDAAMRYKKEGIPLVVIGGKEYGTGSSRDWAAKGTVPARRQSRHHGELRAYPPLQPRRAWACCR